MIITLSILYGIGFALSLPLAVVMLTLKAPAGRTVLATLFWPITLLWFCWELDKHAGGVD